MHLETPCGEQQPALGMRLGALSLVNTTSPSSGRDVLWSLTSQVNGNSLCCWQPSRLVIWHVSEYLIVFLVIWVRRYCKCLRSFSITTKPSGTESCHGDPCSERLLRIGLAFIWHVLFTLEPSLAMSLAIPTRWYVYFFTNSFRNSMKLHSWPERTR